MSNPQSIVFQDGVISSILDANSSNSAAELFDRYRLSGANRDDFVAALIAKLCVLDTRLRLREAKISASSNGGR